MQNSGKSSWFNDNVFPKIMKFVNSKPITAMKNGMIFSLPFLIIGSLFLILANVPFAPVANWMNESGLSNYWNQAFNTSMNVASVFSVVGIAYVWVRDEGFEPLPAGLTALVSFFMIQNLSVANPLNADSYEGFDQLPAAAQEIASNPVGGVFDLANFGAKGAITAILIGMLVGWGYSAMMKRHWTIKLPEQVPASVGNQFAAMIPSAIVMSVTLAVYAFFQAVFNSTVLEQIYTWIQAPLQGLSNSPFAIVFIAFLVPFFWFFGVHGGLIVGSIAGSFLGANSLDNARLYSENAANWSLDVPGVHIVTSSMYDNIINLSGSGITIGLVIFTLFFARSQQMKSIGKIEAVPGVFNINEPFMFGLPIILNPLLAVPFFLTPVIAVSVSYAAVFFRIVPPLTGIQAPWTTPPILSGLIIGGWQWAILQAVVLAISTALYFPFARKFDRVLLEQEKANASAAE
jgi:PTS system cellobiose-specific IIC component